MPRLDDPTLKLKQKKPFVRKSLRPWDDPKEFIPNKTDYTASIEDADGKDKNLTRYARTTEKQQAPNQLVINKESIGDQLVINRESIGDQLVINTDLIGDQLVINRGSIGDQLVINKEINRESIGNQIIAKSPELEHDFENTVYGKIFSTIRGLYGLQKTALFYIVENCKERGLLYTTAITNEFFRALLETDIHGAKTTVQRLIKKELVCRKEAKRGKGGFTVFAISPAVRTATIETMKLLNIDGKKPWMLIGNRESIGNQLVINKVINKVINPTVDSSSYINTTTNLGIDIPENWQGINIEPLEHIGFHLSHLVQIHREYEKKPESLQLSPELIQSSIDAMAFDLKNNEKKLNFQKSPVVVLVSMLKKAQPYNSVTPEKYLSPRDEAMQRYKQIEVERKERELQQMQEIKELELKHWQETLPAEELLTFCPDSEIQAGIPDKVRLAMRRKKAIELSALYFDSAIWPAKKKEIHVYTTTGTEKQTVQTKPNQEQTQT